MVLDEPSVPRIAEALTASTRDATDLLLVYFAGHALVDPRRNQLYLASTGARRHDPEQGTLSYDFLREAVRDGPATTKVIILDCDYLSTDLTDAVVPAITVDGVHVLTGGLLRALQQGSAPDRQFLTLADAYPDAYPDAEVPESPVIGRNVNFRRPQAGAVPRRLLLAGAAVVAGVVVWEILKSDDPAGHPPSLSSSPRPPSPLFRPHRLRRRALFRPGSSSNIPARSGASPPAGTASGSSRARTAARSTSGTPPPEPGSGP